MWYWFSWTSVVLLFMGTLSLSAGLVGGISVGYWHNWVVYVGGVFCLTGAYCIIRRRHAVARFNLIFGFMPSVNEYEEYCRPAVENEIKSRAVLLRNAYRVEDEARDTMRRETHTERAEKAIQGYKDASASVGSCQEMFYGAIDAATSKWLPSPYRRISRKLEDWAPTGRTAVVTHVI